MLQKIKKFLRENKATQSFYARLRTTRDNRIRRQRLRGSFSFDDRSKHQKKACIILAGYKRDVWEDVFGRIKIYLPDDIDFCVITSGKLDGYLQQLCKENGWSYLSTKRNCVSLAQNIAINLFPDAEYIYKLDEDIFVTEGMFDTLYETCLKVEKESFFDVGFVAPLIPINGFAHTEVLKYLGLIDTYTELFERPHISTDNDNMVVGNSKVAQFFWGEGGYVPKIDTLNSRLYKEEFDFTVCPTRFSIGAIMFPRKTWEDMGLFKVEPGNCLGLDETQLCEFCVSQSRAMIVSKNCLVGHLSFGPQNKDMLDYYKENRIMFSVENEVE